MEARTFSNDQKRALIQRMLLADPKHNTPFEHVVFSFLVTAPIFVARQWMRHRIGTFNERSLRFTTAHKMGYFIPGIDSNTHIVQSSEAIEQQYVVISYRIKQANDINNNVNIPSQPFLEDELLAMERDANDCVVIKKLGDTPLPTEIRFSPEETLPFVREMERSIGTYTDLLNAGVRKEIARGVLGTSVYTNFVWTVNLLSFMNWLEKRFHPAAQKEHTAYAREAMNLVSDVVPITMDIFKTKVLYPRMRRVQHENKIEETTTDKVGDQRNKLPDEEENSITESPNEQDTIVIGQIYTEEDSQAEEKREEPMDT